MRHEPADLVQLALAEPQGPLGRLFDALGPASRADLMALATIRRLDAGETVAPEGVESAEVGYVLQGTLAMTRTLADGRVHVVGLLAPTDLFGRVFDGPAGYRIESLTDARVLVFDRAGFEALLRRDPHAERTFLVHMLDELEAAREWVLLIGGHRASARVASLLVILFRRHRLVHPSDQGNVVIALPIPRSDLAHYLGMRPETLSRAVHRLADDGVLRVLDPYRFEIVDPSGLLAASGQDLVLDHPARAAG